MSRLRIFPEGKGQSPEKTFVKHADISRELGGVGIRFEQWESSKPVVPGATQEQVIEAYCDDIESLKREKGYQAVDVISLTPEHPDRAMLRQKFLNEHTHSEDEVRFFVAGRGLFTLHIGKKVYEVLCEKGDLIGVPDGTPHWFDMSESPYFIAIRLFTNKEGWVANFTGSDIANDYPRLSAEPRAA
jgi:1,2-dihydroxy-3-keto-5-methylthiopentene dioxygenase